MKIFPNKRQEKQKTIQELFKVKNVKKLAKQESRQEELLKFKEVQDKTYYYTLTACVLMIIILSCLALFGGYTK